MEFYSKPNRYMVLSMLVIALLGIIITAVFLLYLSPHEMLQTSHTLMYCAGGITILITAIFFPTFKCLAQKVAENTIQNRSGKTVAATPSRSRIYKGAAKGTFIFASIMFAATITALLTINQFHPTTPIETIQGQVVNKTTTTRHKDNVYIQLNALDGAQLDTLDISKSGVYPFVETGDTVTLKVQKGNLGYYFILQLIVDKNNQVIDL